VRDQALGEVESAWIGEVEGEAALVRVRRQEDVAVLPPVAAIWHQRAADHAHAVGALDGLEMDHVRAERGEHPGGRRTRPPRRGVEHADTGQGKRVLVARGARSIPRCDRRFDGTAMLAEARSDTGRGRILVVDAPGPSRLEEGTRRILDECTARPEVLVFLHRGAVVDRRHRDAQLRRALDDLGRGVLRGPRANRRVPLVHPRPAAVDQCELLVRQQVGAIDEQQEILVLLTRVGVEADPAVSGGLDRRQLDGAGRGALHLGAPEHAVEQVGVHRSGDVHHFEQREVDVLAEPGRSRAVHRGERRDGGEGGADPFGGATAGHHRWRRGQTAGGGRSALGLHRELGGRATGVRARPPEGCDREHHQAGVAFYARGGSEPVFFEGLHHEVGVGDQGLYLRVARRSHHGALPRCEELEERRVASREIHAARGEVAQRVATGGLDLHDVGARVGEELRRVAARDPRGQIDHAQISQAVHGAVSPGEMRILTAGAAAAPTWAHTPAATPRIRGSRRRTRSESRSFRIT
jgi:hypothetical protein